MINLGQYKQSYENLKALKPFIDSIFLCGESGMCTSSVTRVARFAGRVNRKIRVRLKKEAHARFFFLTSGEAVAADKATRTRKIKQQEIAVLIKGQTRYRFFLFVDRKTRIPK